jgi:uncharacterized protein YutE (UPF0331/DUF86 family)
MQVNLDLLQQRTVEIRNALAVLNKYAGHSREEFLANQQVVDAAKYRLVVAIEAAISICTHLAARLAQKTPSSYSQCFDVLAVARTLPPELAERLGRMACFRNLLVHLYWEVDDNRVWEVLQHDLGDLEAYLLEVGKVIRRQLS